MIRSREVMHVMIPFFFLGQERHLYVPCICSRLLQRATTPEPASLLQPSPSIVKIGTLLPWCRPRDRQTDRR